MLSTAELEAERATVAMTLSMRCTVKRPGAGSTNAWNHRTPGALANHLTDLPCYLWTETAEEEIGPNTTAVVERLLLMVEVGTDVEETDVIHGVTNELGEVVNPYPLKIDSIVTRPTHLRLTLDQVSTP